jgi:hypothetical protein
VENQRETINLGNLCGGAALEVFEDAVAKIMANIADINTDPTQKREIVLKFSFKPSESREVGEAMVKCETKLASIKAAKGNFFLAKRGGQVKGYAQNPRQEALFATEAAATPQPQ